jgi:hypothetical protein
MAVISPLGGLVWVLHHFLKLFKVVGWMKETASEHKEKEGVWR